MSGIFGTSNITRALILLVAVLPAAARQAPTPQRDAPPAGEAAPPKTDTPTKSTDPANPAATAAGATQCEVELGRYLNNQADADAVCPGLCASLGGWNGHWTNISGAGDAVCKCHPRPKGDLFAGVDITSHQNAEGRCPGICNAGQGAWSNAWRNSPRGGWCGCTNLCRPPCRGDAYSGGARFDSIFRKACHNCYETQYATTLGSAFDSTENIEVDFYDTPRGGITGGEDSYWFVRHDYCCGNENNCTVDGEGDHGLSACLGDVRARSDRDRNHPVYTVFLDKKEGWGGDRTPADLDGLVTSVLGTRLYKPAELKGGSTTLREAAQQDRWPAMDSLRGRILVVLTGGQTVSIDSNKTLDEYVADRGEAAALFVAADTDSSEDVLGNPDGFDNATSAWVVFYNIKAGNAYAAQTVYQQRYVSRLWGGLEDGQAYGSYVEDCVNFIALYNYKRTDFNDGRVTGVLAPQQ